MYCVDSQFENVLSSAVSQLRLRDYQFEVLRFDDQNKTNFDIYEKNKIIIENFMKNIITSVISKTDAQTTS